MCIRKKPYQDRELEKEDSLSIFDFIVSRIKPPKFRIV